jgi:hypothetical protein
MPQQVTYAVYLDESFYKFWTLENPEGNFCYALFALPITQVDSLGDLHAEIMETFKAAVIAMGGEAPREMKSHIFRKLPANTRRRIALMLRQFMQRAGAFVIADFTEVRGFVMGFIRSALAKRGDNRLPDEWENLYDQRRTEIVKLVELGQAGQAPLLEQLLGTPIAGLAHYLMTRAETYSLYFDPREPDLPPEI